MNDLSLWLWLIAMNLGAIVWRLGTIADLLIRVAVALEKEGR